MQGLCLLALLIFVARSSSLPSPVLNSSEVYVQVDSTLELRCKFGDEDDEKTITWKIDKITLAVGPVILAPDDRVEVVDKEGLLKIRSVREEDEGIYHCQVGIVSNGQQRFAVVVDDQPQYGCIPLSDIENGQLFYSGDVDGRPVNGTVAYYECDEGFRLVGTNVSTCDSNVSGWTAEPPFCVNETTYSESLTPRIVSRKQLKKLGRQVESLTKEQEKMREEMDNEITTLNKNVVSVMSASHSMTYAVESVVERLLNRSVARTKWVDGRPVNEFVWHVQRIDKEVERNKSTRHLNSPRFYARIPGYCMQVRVYPTNYPGYLGLYAGLVPGEFDDEVEWPFKGHFELAILSHYKNVSDIVRGYSPLLNTGCSNETFARPDPSDPQACGFRDMMSLKRLNTNPEYYLQDGAMTVRFRLL